MNTRHTRVGMRFFILAAMCIPLCAVPLMPRLGQTATDQTAAAGASGAAAAPSCGKLTLGSMGEDTGAAKKDADAAKNDASDVNDETAGQAAAKNCPDDMDCDGIPDAEDAYPDYDNRIDSDGDGIPDVSDNCITTANPDQKDSDVDGFGDACPEELQEHVEYCQSNPGAEGCAGF